MKKIVIELRPKIIDLAPFVPFIIFIGFIALVMILCMGYGDDHFNSQDEKTRIVRKYDTRENQYYYCAEYLDHGALGNTWRELKNYTV